MPMCFTVGKRDSRGSTPTMDNGKYKESSIPVMGVTVYSTTRTDTTETKPQPAGSRPRCKDYDGKFGVSVFGGGWLTAAAVLVYHLFFFIIPLSEKKKVMGPLKNDEKNEDTKKKVQRRENF